MADAARRELHEETGLGLPCIATPPGVAPSDEVAVFVAEAAREAGVLLDNEHDAFVWLSREEAVAKCLPAQVGLCIANASRWLDEHRSEG